jgi:hypothetical protein
MNEWERQRGSEILQAGGPRAVRLEVLVRKIAVAELQYLKWVDVLLESKGDLTEEELAAGGGAHERTAAAREELREFLLKGEDGQEGPGRSQMGAGTL